jgi:glucose-1-phosphate cytidylyltransferase
MVTIGGKPVLWHIMKIYSNYGHKDFHLALGYKGGIIKDYFLNYRSINSDFTISLDSGVLTTHQKSTVDWNVTLVDTGLNSMTGGRVKRLREFIGNETFLLTYGDGLANININELIAFHKRHGKMITVSAVHPGARFGELELHGDRVLSFSEKPQVTEGWINGGYFVVEPEFFELIEGDSTILEKYPLERAAQLGELRCYRHNGFWQCMDTKRDRDSLEEMWNSGVPPWNG